MFISFSQTENFSHRQRPFYKDLANNRSSFSPFAFNLYKSLPRHRTASNTCRNTFTERRRHVLCTNGEVNRFRPSLAAFSTNSNINTCSHSVSTSANDKSYVFSSFLQQQKVSKLEGIFFRMQHMPQSCTWTLSIETKKKKV